MHTYRGEKEHSRRAGHRVLCNHYDSNIIYCPILSVCGESITIYMQMRTQFDSSCVCQLCCYMIHRFRLLGRESSDVKEKRYVSVSYSPTEATFSISISSSYSASLSRDFHSTSRCAFVVQTRMCAC